MLSQPGLLAADPVCTDIYSDIYSDVMCGLCIENISQRIADDGQHEFHEDCGFAVCVGSVQRLIIAILLFMDQRSGAAGNNASIGTPGHCMQREYNPKAAKDMLVEKIDLDEMFCSKAYH